jgi:hypothetical protein
MEEQINKLNDVLQARVRYVRKWNCVKVEQPNRTSFTVTWYEYQGEPENSAFFESKMYPIKFLNEVILEQMKKLKKDIPANEYNIFKEMCCG